MKLRILRSLGSAALLLAIHCQAQPSPQVTHHLVPPEVSNGRAALVGSLSTDRRLNLSIVLPLRNQDELTALLSRLSNPHSSDYRHFLSVEQFTARFGPTLEDYQAVVDFAQANGFLVTAAPANRIVVSLSGTVAQIEKAFHVSMKVYRHPTENRAFYSPDREPSLNLKVPFAHIGGLNNFSAPHPMVIRPSMARTRTSAVALGSGPDGSYLASDIRAAYYGGTTLTGAGQIVGLLQFDGYDISDVTASFDGAATATADGSDYILAYTPTAGGVTYQVPVHNVLLDGASGASVSGDDSEEVLDIVQAIGMAPGLSQVRVYIGSSDIDILNTMASENIAKQLSISWAWHPDDPLTDDVFFLEFAAQGQTVFAASGDSGAYGLAVPYFYPAEDGWVTAVGGTSLTTNGAGGAWSSETAWGRSGGGISPDELPIPSWQIGLANSSNGGSATRRNVPDVAAEADFDNYSCSQGVCQTGFAGTSFASPRWAGFMALVNEQAVSAGTPTVGFLNPSIYAIGAGAGYNGDFHDITSGNNNYETGVTFFNGVPGYDLVTGWGSPVGQQLIDDLVAPAPAGFQLAALPGTVTVTPGFSGIATVTVRNVGGFTGSVNLAVSGLPTGVTASFGTNPATATSALTLTVAGSVSSGSYLATITGTSGSFSATTTFALAVMAPLTMSPAALVFPSQLNGTQSVPQSVTVTNNQSVALTITSLGVTGDFAQTNTCGTLAPAGQCTISVTFSPTANGTRGGQLLLTDSAEAAPPAVPLSGLGSILTPAEFVGIQPASVGRGWGTATLLNNGKVFLAGGSATSTVVEVYDSASGHFTPAGNMSILRFGHTATLLPNGKVLLAGGLSSYFVYPGQDPFNSTADLYDPAAGTVTPTGSMHARRFAHTATLLPNGKVLIAGGSNLTGGLTSAELYDPSTGVFSVTGAMATARAEHAAVLLNDGTVLIEGGCGMACPVSAETYDPQAGQFSAAGNMVNPPFQASTATLLNSGKVLVVGQFYNSTENAQLYDPSTRSFSQTGNAVPYGVASFATAALLNTGLVLVSSTAATELVDNGAQLYNPQTGSFTVTSNMTRPRINHTATAMGNGQVLIVGGDQIGCTPVSGNQCTPVYGPSAEIYVAQSLAPPLFSPAPGTYTSAQKVTLTAADGAAIYYTLDGTAPTSSSTPYTAAIDCATETIQAIAVFNGNTSAVASGAYIVKVPAPVFSPPAGTYASAQSVTITDDTAGATIVYTINGTTTQYTGPITVGASETIQASASFPGGTNSPLASAAYVINAATPVFSPPAGLYTSAQSVTITDPTPGATIYYTTGGDSPTTSSTLYTGAISVAATETIQAIGVSNGISSAVGAATYTIGPPSAPVFSPPAGTYSAAQSVTITDATAGAVIYYYINGKPAIYTAPITVAASETIQALAVVNGTSDSAWVTADYVISSPTVTPVLSPPAGTYTSAESVTITDATAGAAIYYTTNGATPTATSLPYTGAISVAATETIQAIAIAAGYSSSTVASAVYTITPPAAIPVFSPPAGTYTSTQGVTITDATPGSSIYYTTNGTTPTAASTPYEGAISVAATETIQAIAVAAGYSRSVVASAVYTITPPAATPVLSPAAGTYTSAQTVTITDTTTGATIYYATNGTAPTTASTKYTAPIYVAATETIQAIAVATGYSTSAVASAAYTLNLPASPPVLSPAAGTYTSAQTVTITDTTPGATVYYTTNGTAPTTSSTKYTVPISVAATETIQAIAVATGYSTSAVVSAAYTINLPASPPVLSPAAGTYTSAQTVTITDATANSTIYYTTNGTAPTTSSTKYTAPVSVAATETIQAIAVATGYSTSAVVSTAYTINLPASTPSFSPSAGTYTSTQTVTITDATSGATIYYTTNGTTPTPSSSKYTAPISVAATETIQAIAVAAGHANSPVVSAVYTINLPAVKPSFAPPAGTYTSTQSVSITTTTAGATIYYTTNGTTPTTSSTKYTAPIPVAATETIQAIAVAAGHANSPVSSAAYTINLPAAKPSFSPPAGTYTTAQKVTITDTTTATTIYYTTNGTAPTTSSTKYTAPISVAATETIQAIAVAAGHANSPVSSAAYTINLPAAKPVFSPPPEPTPRLKK